MYVALSTGASFGPGQLWHSSFGYNLEIPMLGDFDADERADAIVFTQGSNALVWVAKANN